jgi:hypothetical protein
MTAKEGVELLLEKRGYVVVGVPAGQPNVVDGERFFDFGGRPIAPYVLRREKRTTKKDWDDQFQILFGASRQNPREKGGRFYRCEVEREAE